MKLSVFVFWLISVIPLAAQFVNAWEAVPEEIRSKNSFKRYEWFYRPRTDAQGKFPFEHVNRIVESEEQKIREAKSKDPEGTSDLWTNIGPVGINMSSSFIPYWGTVSGRVRGLAVHPTNPNIVYVGAASGGIWKTTDGGSTWVDKSSGLSRLTFGSIAIDPGNTNIIFAGTGEAMWLLNNVTYEGNGLYKSTDAGDTWTQITNGFGASTQFSDISVNPTNSQILIAALGSGNYNNSNPSNEGIWRSTDGGTTWTRTLNVQDGFDVAFHPTNGNLAYASSGNKEAASGFYRSTNGGATWTQSNTGLTATTIGRMQFDISPSDPGTVYSIIFSNAMDFNTRQTAAFKSTDGGVSWAQISSGQNIAGSYNGSSASDQGFYDLCVAVHPTNKNIVMFGNVEVSRTSDGSSISFVRNPSGYQFGLTAWDSYAHVDIHKIVFAPSNGNIVYLACDGGVYKSTDAGLTFTSVNIGINTIQFYRVASHPTNSSILFGGAQDNGNFSTADKGATSWVFETSGDGMECFVDYSDPNYVYMSTQYGRMYRSTDGGASFTTIGYSTENTAWVAPFWQHPTSPSFIYAALNRSIYRSSNRGTDWGAISTVTASNSLTSVEHSKVNTLKMVAVASDYTTSPQVYISTNEGIGSWTSITTNVTNAGFSGVPIQRVILDPVSENTFYLTRASYAGGQVIKTTDFGTTWSNVSGSGGTALPAVPVNDLFIDPANTAHLYAGSDVGVYWSSNGGINWTRLGNNMPIVPVQDFSFFSNGGARFLRAATHGRGVYELQIDTPLPVELVSFAALTSDEGVKLQWSTASEINNFGFDIEKSSDGNSFTKIGFVPGNGNSNSPKNYEFTDRNANGFLRYRLKQIDNDGAFTYSDVVSAEVVNVTDYAIYQNYPNPFNAQTVIAFKVPQESKVRVTILDPLGQIIEQIADRTYAAGIHEVIWDAGNLASGGYFASLSLQSVSGNTGLNKTLKLVVSK